ncbi:MAG: hypothetical protein HC833_10760 [Leptolyngbyaceae cyanobacterium RM1_406_9]|nr:hypothetical protein [Leptolyngbyaceae cyanobacterium RM1_406_9]
MFSSSTSGLVHTRVIPQADGFSLLSISDRIALMYRALKRPGKGGRKDRIQCGYFGFESQEKAQAWAEMIRNRYAEMQIRLVVRESDRLPECAFEVKVWEFEGLIPLTLCCAKSEKTAAEEMSHAA